MATLHITEFSTLPRDANGNTLLVGKMPAPTQAVSYTSSAQSAAFASGTTFIRVIADEVAHLAFGANPTATANHPWIPADTAELFAVTPAHKVAVYDGSTV